MADISQFIAKTTNQASQVGGLVSSVGNLLGSKSTPEAKRADLNTFRSSFLSSGVLKNNRFFVEIPPPKMMYGKFNDAIKAVPFAAESTSLPGVMFATSEINRWGVGPIEKKPYRPIFVDLNISFISDGNGLIYDFFYNWMQGMIKSDVYHTNPNERTSSTGRLQTVNNSYQVEYKDQYRTDITIVTFNEKNNEIIRIKLFDAYPITIGDIPLSWSNTNDFVRIPVIFAYTNWTKEVVQITADKNGPLNIAGVLQQLQSFGAAVNVLSSIRRPRSIGDLAGVINNTNLALGGMTGLSRN
jgi:hypothetical protein